MKSYKNVELFAKNAPTGSYAAGCPTHERASNGGARRRMDSNPNQWESCSCAQCEVAG